MGCDEHHAQLLGRQHHGDINVTREVGEPFGVPGIGKAGEVQRVLVGRGRDDGVDLALEGEPHRTLDGVPREAAGTDDPVAVAVLLAAPQLPAAHRHPVGGGHRGDLVLGADDRDVGVDRRLRGRGR